MVGLAFLAQQRGAGKSDELRVLQAGAHVLCQVLVLGTMSLVHNHDDVAAGRQERIGLALIPTKLLDECEHQPLVLPEELSHLLAVLGLRSLGFGDRVRV